MDKKTGYVGRDGAGRKVSDAILAMPKSELHVHIEGAMGPELIWSIAQKNGIRLPALSREDWIARYEFRGFEHFISVFDASVSAIQTEEDWADIIAEFMEKQIAQNIMYTEAFLSVSLHLSNLSPAQLLSAIEKGREMALRKYGGSCTLSPTFPGIARRPSRMCSISRLQDWSATW